VPRLYERIHAAIIAEADKSPVKRALVNLTARIGWQFYEADRHRAPAPGPLARLAWPVLQCAVANRTMAAFGGRLRVAVSGGAALPTDVARLLVGMGLPLVEGYGLTEAGPVVTATTLEDSLPGSVGRPLHGLDVRLGDNDELLVRSPAVMSGYWNNPEATSEALIADDWLKTGDVAHLHDERIYIEGRLADTIILSTGENINPNVIEDSILRDPLFEQACVIGSGRPCLSALIVLNEERWNTLAGKLNIAPHLPNTGGSAKHILRQVNGRLADMPKHGMVRAVYLMREPWTIQDGLLTPTLKIKRKVVEGRFHDEIVALYEQMG
jgi:long-chain acyl-CoA synthetase